EVGDAGDGDVVLGRRDQGGDFLGQGVAAGSQAQQEGLDVGDGGPVVGCGEDAVHHRGPGGAEQVGDGGEAAGELAHGAAEEGAEAAGAEADAEDAPAAAHRVRETALDHAGDAAEVVGDGEVDGGVGDDALLVRFGEAGPGDEPVVVDEGGERFGRRVAGEGEGVEARVRVDPAAQSRFYKPGGGPAGQGTCHGNHDAADEACRRTDRG